MKVRGLILYSSICLVIALAASGLYKLNSLNEPMTKDIKSQLTERENSQVLESKNSRSLKEVMAQNLKKQEEMQERKDFEGSILEQERHYTEEEIKNFTEDSFKDLLKETELKLPKLSDIKKLPPGALHRTPTPVIKAGKDLGLIKEILLVHESYERTAIGFYDRCAKSTLRPTPVRALCLTNLIEVKKKNGEKLDLAQYPGELIELAKMITDI